MELLDVYTTIIYNKEKKTSEYFIVFDYDKARLQYNVMDKLIIHVNREEIRMIHLALKDSQDFINFGNICFCFHYWGKQRSNAFMIRPDKFKGIKLIGYKHIKVS